MAGITTESKPATPKHIVPDDKENIKLSKSQFIEKKRKLKEKELKLREYARELEEKESGNQVGDVEVKEEVKRVRRPKKIID